MNIRKLRIKIIGDHPHAGECGTVELNDDGTVSQVRVLKSLPPMAMVNLESCPHGINQCFAESYNIQKVKS